uniref:Exocyst complex component Sec8 n=1 Tax=Strigamia maritima TaxID=126957 RepID=T1IIX1_STRMM
MAKTTQELPNRLMKIISALSESESSDQRDKEKASLEKAYKRSDQRLDELIAENHEALTITIQKFSQISGKLTMCRQKITTIKENLIASKNLLNCKRDELTELWLSGIKHKHSLYLLEQIQVLKDVPTKINDFIRKKHFLHATKLLVTSNKLLEGDLKEIDGLKEIKLDLQAKKLHMCDVIIDEIHNHLYVRSISELNLIRNQDNSFFRRGSDRKAKDLLSPKIPEKNGGGTPVKRNILSILATTPTHKYKHKQQLSVVGAELEEDLTAEDPEEDALHYLTILVESLALLNCMSDAVEVTRNRVEKELLNLVRVATKQIYEDTQAYKEENLSSQKQPQVLLKLIHSIFEQFFCVTQAHEHLLDNLKQAATSHQIDLSLYSIEEVWSKIQSVLQAFISDYLDIQNTSGQSEATLAFTETKVDINSFFRKKRKAPVKNKRLFRFDAKMETTSESAQEPKFNACEINGEESNLQEKLFVTCPDQQNITVIFKPLMKFVSEIETTLGYLEGSQCILHTFLTDFVKDVFLVRLQEVMTDNVDEASKSLDAWLLADPKMLKTLNVTRPLLQSTVITERSIHELQQLMSQHLPQYSENFLNMICNILISYRDMCESAFRSVIQPESAEKRIISATWAQDENISHFLRTLPNWRNLQQLKNNKTPDYEESHDEIQQRNLKESNMLIENIGFTAIPLHEILSDVALLRVLALLQESLEWFGDQVSKFALSLPNNSGSSGSTPTTPVLDVLPVADNTIQSLLQVSRDFTDLADKCLLILHLEVRVHCFYYLLPLFKQGTFASWRGSQNLDNEITNMKRDLNCIDAALSTSLQSRKCRYVFEGLGQLIASIMINSVQLIKRINENGIKKMCTNISAIQQTLTNITASREVALDHAREYYKLLYMSIEDLFDKIVDQGRQFTEFEYVNAVKLLNNSKTDDQPDSDPVELNRYLKRLNDILNEVAVTNRIQQNNSSN